MRRFLRFSVPSAQVLAVLLALGWEKIASGERTLPLYVLPTRHFLLNLNFPLAAVWWSLFKLGDRLLHLWPLGQTNQLALAVEGVVFFLVLMSSVTFFWYFVVVEIQTRSKGKSLVRFAHVKFEFVRILVFLACGLGCLFRAYSETLRPFEHDLARYGLWPVEIVLSALVLITWGVTFVISVIVDFRKLSLDKKN